MELPVATCWEPFATRLRGTRLELARGPIETLQINLGKLCNQACHHCHVEAGPKRTEIMARATVERILELVSASPEIRTIDLTGGAPELNPHFRYLVSELVTNGREVTDRCNLTVLFESGQEDTAEFLREHRVHIIASLPCYTADNVDEQRGRGVFAKSIRALQNLNRLGYGCHDSPWRLDLVYNPVGAFLPPDQSQLEADYKEQLKADFGIEFNQLYALSNVPIKRFLHELKRTGQHDAYMTLLANSFNVQAALGVMCRQLISIGWDGQIYDCDFNQMLEIPAGGQRRDIWEIESFAEVTMSPIAFADHCYACTAGAGSSCSGAITSKGETA